MNQIGENGKKNLVLGLSLAHLAQIQTANPPPPPKKNLAPSITRCHGQLSSSTTSEKTNNPILRKFSDRRTDRQQ